MNWLKLDNFINKIIKNLSINLRLNFNRDTILKKELIYHIKPAIYRIKNDLSISSDISTEIKLEYPDIFEGVFKSFQISKEYIDIEFNEEELSIITIMVVRAIKRINKSKLNQIKKVLVICDLGYSASKLIVETLIDKFNIEILDVIPYNHIKNYNKMEKIDFILTTVNFNFEIIKKPIFKINLILKSNDIDFLEKMGLPLNKNKISETQMLKFIVKNKNKTKEEILRNLRNMFHKILYQDDYYDDKKNLVDYINEKNTILNSDLKNINQVIEKINDILLNNNFVEMDYKEIIKQQIEKYGENIFIGKNTVLIHGETNIYVKKTGFVIITLEKPIKLYNNSMSIIFVLVSKNKEDYIKAILDLTFFLKINEFEQIFSKFKDLNEMIAFLNRLSTDFKDGR